MTKPIAPKRQAETRSAVERTGAFAAAARPEHLTTDIRQLFKRNILDSIGCAIAAVAGPSLRPLRDQLEEYRAPGRCTSIGGGKSSPDQAALFNSALVRYVDLLDSYMAQGGLCHPSDNFGTILAAAEYVGASGEEFMLALAAAYEIQCRFTACVPVMAKGFNHAIQLAISAAAGAGRLFGLSVNELADAIAIAAVDNISLTCVHAEPVSQWKGFSPGITGMRAVYAASLAKRGFTGPKGLFEGPYGLEQMFAQSIPVNSEDPSLAVVKQTIMKKYCSLIHGQPVLEAVLDLKRRNSLTADEIEHVRCNVSNRRSISPGAGASVRRTIQRSKSKATIISNTLSLPRCSTIKLGPPNWRSYEFRQRMLRPCSRGSRFTPTSVSALAILENSVPLLRFAPKTSVSL
jgi:2-methylcitrate dehydratase